MKRQGLATCNWQKSASKRRIDKPTWSVLQSSLRGKPNLPQQNEACRPNSSTPLRINKSAPTARTGRKTRHYRGLELNRGDEVAVEGDVAAGHTRGVEGEAGISDAIEKDEAAGSVRAFGEKVDGFAGG